MWFNFSASKTQPILGSLRNNYKCLEKSQKIKFIKRKHGDLESLSEQGVLLLNATLTVECKKKIVIRKNVTGQNLPISLLNK